MDIVRANIVDAKQFLLLIREQHYELEELKYERYLEENGLCLKVSNPSRPCVSAGGPNDLSHIPVHIEQFVKKDCPRRSGTLSNPGNGKRLYIPASRCQVAGYLEILLRRLPDMGTSRHADSLIAVSDI